jgi:hypothetical protein
VIAFPQELRASTLAHQLVAQRIHSRGGSGGAKRKADSYGEDERFDGLEPTNESWICASANF